MKSCKGFPQNRLNLIRSHPSERRKPATPKRNESRISITTVKEILYEIPTLIVLSTWCLTTRTLVFNRISGPYWLNAALMPGKLTECSCWINLECTASFLSSQDLENILYLFGQIADVYFKQLINTQHLSRFNFVCGFASVWTMKVCPEKSNDWNFKHCICPAYQVPSDWLRLLYPQVGRSQQAFTYFCCSSLLLAAPAAPTCSQIQCIVHSIDVCSNQHCNTSAFADCKNDVTASVVWSRSIRTTDFLIPKIGVIAL